MAQTLHRFDMRLRLGNIRDTSASRKQTEAAAAIRKLKPSAPTVKTEAEAKAEEEAIAKAKALEAEAAKKPPKPHIRPLSEAKAIESGAGFLSESFLFLVAGGLIVFETLRARRKDSTRREDVAGRLAQLEQNNEATRKALVALEKEILQLKSKNGQHVQSGQHILPRTIWEDEIAKEAEEQGEGWLSWAQSYISYLSSAIQGEGSRTLGKESGESTSEKPSTDAPAPGPGKDTASKLEKA